MPESVLACPLASTLASGGRLSQVAGAVLSECRQCGGHVHQRGHRPPPSRQPAAGAPSSCPFAGAHCDPRTFSPCVGQRTAGTHVPVVGRQHRIDRIHLAGVVPRQRRGVPGSAAAGAGHAVQGAVHHGAAGAGAAAAAGRGVAPGGRAVRGEWF